MFISQKTKKFLSYILSSLTIVVLLMPLFISAAEEGCGAGSGEGCVPGGGGKVNINVEIKNPFKQNSIQGLLKTIIDEILIPVGSVVAVVMIMYAGFMYVTARGEPAKITKARDALLWAVIGAAILLGAWVLSTAITNTVDQLRAP